MRLRAPVVSLPWSEGGAVKEGAILLELTTLELQLRWRRAKTRLERLRWQSSSAGVNAEQRQNLQVLEREEQTAQAELANVQAKMGLYVPTAPFTCILLDLQPDLKPVQWMGNRECFGVLVKTDRWQVETQFGPKMRSTESGGRAVTLLYRWPGRPGSEVAWPCGDSWPLGGTGADVLAVDNGAGLAVVRILCWRANGILMRCRSKVILKGCLSRVKVRRQ